MPPEVAKHLQDIQDACILLARFSAGKSLADYQNDPLLRSAVERQFITIGEALQQALKHDGTLANVITDVRKIIGFRNVLVHGYGGIDNATVWGVLENGMPVLQLETAGLLRQLGPP